MSLVRNTLNSRQPINQIPAEVLSVIFEHVPKGYPADDRSMWPFSFHQPACLQSVTLVCQRWHDIALQDVHLWSCVSISESEVPPDDMDGHHATRRLYNTCIQRSKNALLSAHARDGGPLTLNVISSVAPRIRQLIFSGDPTLQFPAPSIQHLQLSNLQPNLKPRTVDLYFDHHCP